MVPGGPSDQSSLPDTCGRDGYSALDSARVDAKRRPPAERIGAITDHQEMGDRRVRHEPDAGRIARRGDTPRRGGTCDGRECRCPHSQGTRIRRSFMDPLETDDFNAPTSVHDFVERYGLPFRKILDSMHGVVRSGAVPDGIETQRGQRVCAEDPAGRPEWGDRRLMALLV